jgi:hypothetical protein
MYDVISGIGCEVPPNMREKEIRDTRKDVRGGLLH